MNAFASLKVNPNAKNVLNAAAYVSAVKAGNKNNAMIAANRLLGRATGMARVRAGGRAYPNAALRKFWENVNAGLKAMGKAPPNTATGPKTNVLGPKAKAAIQWVKNHPRLSAIGTVLSGGAVPILAGLGAAGANIGAAGVRGAKAATGAAMAPGAIAAEIRGKGADTVTNSYLASVNGQAVISKAVNSWANKAKVNGTRLAKAQAMNAAYKGNAAAKKTVTNAVQSAWPRGSRFKYNVTNTNKFMNYVSKSYIPENKNANVAEFKSRAFWSGVAGKNDNATATTSRALAYWQQNNLNQNKVFKNRTATGAGLANFWKASNALGATAFGTNANANKLRNRKSLINAAWKRQETSATRARAAAMKSLFSNASNTNITEITAILNTPKNWPVVAGINNATRAAIKLPEKQRV